MGSKGLEGLSVVTESVLEVLQWVPGSVVGLHRIFENLSKSLRRFHRSSHGFDGS